MQARQLVKQEESSGYPCHVFWMSRTCSLWWPGRSACAIANSVVATVIKYTRVLDYTEYWVVAYQRLENQPAFPLQTHYSL